MHWRIEKAGYEPFEGAPFSGGAFAALASLELDLLGQRPAGTVRVPGGPLARVPLIRPVRFLAGTPVEPYYLERYEVTNRQYKEFVDAGGYSRPEWWPSAMERGGRDVPWNEAVDAFRDPTGRYGPSTWELGDHPEGEGEHPVSGISWFEAWAYCAFAGRSLPTIYHWFHAIGQEQSSDILLHSNMDGEAKAPVGQFKGLAAWGAYDMAGNVKEWAWNATGEERYILGGAWNEPAYLFRHLVSQDPWSREPTHGVRCAQYPDPPAENLTAPVTPVREYSAPEPISDEAFEVLRSLYRYDEDPLEAQVERVDESPPGYRRKTVSIRTAYGDERMEINLLIPRDAAPPYSSVIWFPGDDAFAHRSSESFSSEWLFDFLPRAGRVGCTSGSSRGSGHPTTGETWWSVGPRTSVAPSTTWRRIPTSTPARSPTSGSAPGRSTLPCSWRWSPAFGLAWSSAGGWSRCPSIRPCTRRTSRPAPGRQR
jgi:hypothetical protein